MANVLPRIINRFEGIALDLLFPQWCVACGRGGNYICPACRRSLVPSPDTFCPGCGRPQLEEVLCRRCATSPSEIDGIRSPFVFGGVMRQAIHELKYRNLRALAAPLGQLLYEYVAAKPLPAEVLVPVPLHRSRWLERGYNQSELLARELGRLTGLPVINDCLVRHLPTTSQARTTAVSQRQSNVARDFSCRDGRLQGKQVLVIDDVSTSGATLNACAGALKTAGAASVWGLTLAAEL